MGGELVVVDVVMVVCLLCNQSTTQPHYTFHMQLLGHYDVQCPLQSNHNMFPSLVPSPPPVLSVIPHIACRNDKVSYDTGARTIVFSYTLIRRIACNATYIIIIIICIVQR